MDAIKSAVGIGKKDQEGTEPVSGEQGEGTTAQPFDEGNKPAATNSADQAGNTSEIAAESKEAEDKTAVVEGAESSSQEQKSGVSSWFKVGPFGSKRKSVDESAAQASAGAEESGKAAAPPSPKLPPNQLGENVPPGASTDLGAPAPGEEKAPAALEEKASAPAPAPEAEKMASNDDAPTFKSPFSNEDIGKESFMNESKDTAGPSDTTNRQPSGPKMQQLKSSRAFSVASPAADKSRREPIKANNPGSIPTAGGIAMGQRAAEDRERRKSQWSSQPDMPELDKEGSPDAATQNNTQANVVPQTASDEASSSKAASTPRTDSKSSGLADKVSDKLPDKPAAANSGRRASRLDGLKKIFK